MFANMRNKKGIRKKALILDEPIVPVKPTNLVPFHKHIIYGKNSKVIPFDVKTDLHKPIIIHMLKELIPKVDEDVLDQVQRIIVQKPPEKGLIGQFDIDNGWLYVFPNKDLTENDYRDTIIHELHHGWYLKTMKDEPKKVEEYNKQLDLLPPPTNYARRYYDAWKEVQVILQRKDVKSTEELEHYRQAMKELEEAYYDEVHSETGEFIESNQKEKKEIEVLNPDVMQMAVKLYKQLHE